MKPAQKESLNFELRRLFNDFSHTQQCAENSNSQKKIIFCIQMGKAWHFILKPNQRKKN
jgi:hypothetical protein